MATLYRKYRPQSFKEAFGQNYIKIILEHQLATDKLAHAYIFCGPRAVGKTTLARILAKSVNCLNRQPGESEPCGHCEACQEIVASRALDVVEIDAASHTGVDNVREHIIANAKVVPSRFKKKVFIIDEVHMLSTQAFNALLKTLEEPPANVIFVLCTTEIHKVPQTIISRCQRFDFKRISLNDMVRKLQVIVMGEEVEVDKKILEAVARQADGHMRDAESTLGQLINIGGDKITEDEASLVIPKSDLSEALNLLSFIAQRETTSAVRLLNKLLDDGFDLKIFTVSLLELLRKILLLKINPSLIEHLGLEMGEQLELRINEVKELFSHEQVIYLIDNFSKAREEMKHSFIVQLPLELVIARIAMGSSTIKPVTEQAVSVQPVQNKQIQPTTSSQAISIDEVLGKWQEFLLRLKKHNHSLSFILRVCEPRQVNGNEVSLAFKYKFHKERVSEPKVKSLIEQILQEVHGAKLVIEALVDEDISADLSTSANSQPLINQNNDQSANQSANQGGEEVNPVISDLLKTFGGKIVG